MNTWQTELVKELKTIIQGWREASKPTEALDGVISMLETVACDEADIASRLNALGLQWFANKIPALDYHQKARTENDKVLESASKE